MNRTQSLMLIGIMAAVGGCQNGSKVIPGYSKIDQPSGLTEVRFIAKGIE